MKKVAKTVSRHFPYEHPTFGTEKRPKPESAWQKSIYYWWWEYLKRNTEYIECCQSGGKGNLAELYKDFGDIRDVSFKTWWAANDRGANLFAEPILEHNVRLLETGEIVQNQDASITIAVPLNLPKRFLNKKLREILSEHHTGKKGHQFAKKSRAKYKVQGQPNIPGIKQTLAVYDFWLDHPELTLWEIGNQLPRFMMNNKIKPKDLNKTDKMNRLAAAVSRYIKKAKKSIKSTSNGLFP